MDHRPPSKKQGLRNPFGQQLSNALGVGNAPRPRLTESGYGITLSRRLLGPSIVFSFVGVT